MRIFSTKILGLYLVLSLLLRILHRFYIYRSTRSDHLFNMPGKTQRKPRPLRRCRKLFSWFCADVIDKPLNNSRARLKRIFRFMIGVFIIASAVIANSSLVLNYSETDIDGLFVGFYQFMITLIEIASTVVMVKLGPKLPSLFRNLDKIHATCKRLQPCAVLNCKWSISDFQIRTNVWLRSIEFVSSSTASLYNCWRNGMLCLLLLLVQHQFWFLNWNMDSGKLGRSNWFMWLLLCEYREFFPLWRNVSSFKHTFAVGLGAKIRCPGTSLKCLQVFSCSTPSRPLCFSPFYYSSPYVLTYSRSSQCLQVSSTIWIMRQMNRPKWKFFKNLSNFTWISKSMLRFVFFFFFRWRLISFRIFIHCSRYFIESRDALSFNFGTVFTTSYINLAINLFLIQLVRVFLFESNASDGHVHCFHPLNRLISTSTMTPLSSACLLHLFFRVFLWFAYAEDWLRTNSIRCQTIYLNPIGQIYH